MDWIWLYYINFIYLKIRLLKKFENFLGHFHIAKNLAWYLYSLKNANTRLAKKCFWKCHSIIKVHFVKSPVINKNQGVRKRITKNVKARARLIAKGKNQMNSSCEYIKVSALQT